MCDRGNRYNQKERLSLKGLPKINFIELEKLQKRKLACKHDWGNTNFCKNCLLVDNCPVT